MESTKSRKGKTRWNNYAIDGGFIQIPNLLITHHEELGIDEKELMFLIKLSAHRDTFKLHDNQVIKGSQKTAYRRRQSLKQKGLLDYTEHKEFMLMVKLKQLALHMICLN